MGWLRRLRLGLVPNWSLSYVIPLGGSKPTLKERLDQKRKEGGIMDFDYAVEKVMEIEGGYVNDPTDPGGETKFGISKRTFPQEDIFNLTRDRARELYLHHYWLPGKCAQLPKRLRLIYFDMCVLHSQFTAVKVLQRALNGAGISTVVDGILGEATLKNATYLEPERLRAYRVLRIARIVIAKPSQEKFWFGWYKRASQV